MLRDLGKRQASLLWRDPVDVRSRAKQVGYLPHAQTKLLSVVATREMQTNRRYGARCSIIPGEH